MTKNEKKWYHKSSSTYDKETDTHTYPTDYWKIASITTLTLSAFLIFISLVLAINWTTNIGVPIRREFTNYINSADDMYDPHTIIQALDRALRGIDNLNIKPTDNAAIFSWNKNYRHTPQFTIDQITSVIDYADTLIEWQQQSYYNTTVIEVAADVYDEKLSHLRDITDDIDASTIGFAYCLKTPGCLWHVYNLTLFMTGMFTLLAALMFAVISSET